MNKLITCLATVTLTLPLGASAATFEIVNPGEQMVTVPGLEFLGQSRISTVEHCSVIEGLDWRNLLTDSDFQLMHDCIVEHT